MQATISKIVKFSGIGLHNNEICNITIKPSQDGIKKLIIFQYHHFMLTILLV